MAHEMDRRKPKIMMGADVRRSSTTGSAGPRQRLCGLSRVDWCEMSMAGERRQFGWARHSER